MKGTTRAMLPFLLGAALGMAQPALAAGDVSLSLTAKKEITLVAKDGKKTRKLVEPKATTPGDVIVYLLEYRNKGGKAKEHVVITDPIPQATAYIAGSATGAGAEILFSVDGKHFAPEGKVRIKGADGKQRPADPADYRYIRWKLKKPLAPGKSGTASFKVRVK